MRAVQFYLRRLAAYYSDVPTVTVDGTFGAATTRAVRAWQERAGLTVDGTVGRLTWQSIYDAVQALETSGPVVRVVGLTSPTRTLRPGDSGPEILQLNRLLLFLNQWIPEINFLAGTEPSDTFDSELEIAVRSAQRYFGAGGDRRGDARNLDHFPRCRFDAAGRDPRRGRAGTGRRVACLGPGIGQRRPGGIAGAAVAQPHAAVNQGANFVPETGVFDRSYAIGAGKLPAHRRPQPLGVVDADTWESLRLAAQGICRKCGTRRDNYGKTVRVRCLQQPLLHL